MSERDEVLVKGVFNPLPRGARDLLPDTCRRRRALTNALLDRFEAWGYEQVMPPAIEYFDVLARGLGREERDRTVRFIEAGSGELVGLRSDVTPQIARMVAQRVGGSVRDDETVRLCYAADVVRTSHGRRGRAEVHQVGVEFVGDDEPIADAELISLCHEALAGIGLEGYRFDLSHNAIVRSALRSLRLSATAETQVRGRLARKDAAGLAELLRSSKVPAKKRAALVSLAELNGASRALSRARELLAPLKVDAALDRLDKVMQAVESEDPEAAERISLDLGEVRGYDYYTGLRVRVWAPGVSAPIARGGRYDDMLMRYGANLPATGLAIDLDALESALRHADLGVEGADPRSGRLIVYDGGQPRAVELRQLAVAEARRVRARGLRAWVDGRVSLRQAQSDALARGIDRISYYSCSSERGADVERSRWKHAARGWRRDDRKR